MEKIKLPSNKSFGLIFFIFFCLISLYPIIQGDQLRIWALLIAIIFLVLGITNSKILTPFNLVWINFGLKLGKIVSPLVMSIIYFLVVTPIGILMRQFKDPLNLKKSNKKTYWKKKDKKVGTIRNQF